MGSHHSASPSPRFSSDAARSCTLVTDDGQAEAHSWWACLLVCSAHQRRPPLAAATVEAAAPAVEVADGPVLLTPRQAWRLGATVAELGGATAPPPPAGPLTASVPAPYSREYVYDAAALAGRADRNFRKACRKAEAALAARALMVHAVAPGRGMGGAALRGCAGCRRRWMERRARDARDAARREGRRYEGPPWAGVTRQGFLAAAAELCAPPLPGDQPPPAAMALLLVVPAATPRPAPAAEDGTGAAAEQEATEVAAAAEEEAAVVAYLLTERVGRTVVAVEGVHDYSLAGVDPSALLLHHAARWWRGERGAAGDEGAGDGGGGHDGDRDGGGGGGAPARDDSREGSRAAGAGGPPPPPLWVNDGPVPTEGLLRYKEQYHGALLQVYSLRNAALVRASARARWAELHAAWRRSRGGKLYVGEKKIRRAARYVYASEVLGR
eukprot:Transcript_9478.p1 GENE.Transcript_9478~~Transcript_9478.p1  ORF type:complete len:441 (-),score=113.41 Transcript_9478:67-1389(-)